MSPPLRGFYRGEGRREVSVRGPCCAGFRLARLAPSLPKPSEHEARPCSPASLASPLPSFAMLLSCALCGSGIFQCCGEPICRVAEYPSAADF